MLETYQEEIETAIRKLSLPDEPRHLYDPILYFIAIGGKRIRPTLTLMSSELFGERPQNAMDVAIGIELFHNYTLLHDDLMDQSSIRRNHPTVHEKWNANTAILSGDTLFVLAMQQILKGNSNELNEAFLHTAREVCEGQRLDIDYENRPDITISQYLEMIRLKTSVLISFSLYAGAVLAETTEENKQKMFELGINIGLAFQIQDDYLDTFGKGDNIGKVIGGDIWNNKNTYLYLKAKELASDTQHERLEALASMTLRDSKIRKTTEIYRNLGIGAKTKAKINEYFQTGMKILDELDVAADRKKELIALLDFLYKRNA